MNPREFLDVADDLATGMREADWRSATSRAYYAAFHVARLLLKHCGFAVPRADQAHAYVWLRLSNCGHPVLSKAGTDLRDLRTSRNRADYDLDLTFLQPIAIGDVRIADDIIKLLDQVPTLPHVQQQITDAIRLYERDVLKQVTWQPPPP
jgi:uncharacterized protein (UPF0332 family)